MNDPGGQAPIDEESNPELAAIAEEITRRLESGERVDADDYAGRHPSLLGEIRRLLPTVHDLVTLGSQAARRPDGMRLESRTAASSGEPRRDPDGSC